MQQTHALIGGKPTLAMSLQEFRVYLCAIKHIPLFDYKATRLNGEALHTFPSNHNSTERRLTIMQATLVANFLTVVLRLVPGIGYTNVTILLALVGYTWYKKPVEFSN